jgi:hypothetical protein
MSISPLDRLLNQRGLDDEVGVEISCESRSGTTASSGLIGQTLFTTETQGMKGATAKNYTLKLNKESINTVTCWNGTKPGNNGCPVEPA